MGPEEYLGPSELCSLCLVYQLTLGYCLLNSQGAVPGAALSHLWVAHFGSDCFHHPLSTSITAVPALTGPLTTTVALTILISIQRISPKSSQKS